MKAQLTFLGIFMKVVLMLLILALCFTGNTEKKSACSDTQKTSQILSFRDIATSFLSL